VPGPSLLGGVVQQRHATWDPFLHHLLPMHAHRILAACLQVWADMIAFAIFARAWWGAPGPSDRWIFAGLALALLLAGIERTRQGATERLPASLGLYTAALTLDPLPLETGATMAILLLMSGLLLHMGNDEKRSEGRLGTLSCLARDRRSERNKKST
jgi:hypothetical protein